MGLVSLILLLGSMAASDVDRRAALGRYFLQQGSPGRAISQFEAVLAAAPSRADTWYALGVALRLWGDPKGAEDALKKALLLQPRFPEAHFELGLVLGDRVGSEQEGLAEFEATVAQEPKHADAHFNIGVIRWKSGNPEAAVGAFGKAVELNPRSAEFRFRLGQALARLGRATEAERELTRSVELDPAYAKARYQLGLVLREMGQDQRAAVQMDIWRGLRSQGPTSILKDHSWLLYRQGLSALERRRTAEAVDLLRRALEGAPVETPVRNALGIALQRSADLAAAETEFRKVLSTDSNSVDAHLNLGAVLIEKRDLAGAEREFRTCVAIDPNFAEAHYNLGLVLAAQKRWPEAAGSLSASVQLDPGNARAHWMLARVLRDSGSGAAPETYRKACLLDPALADAHEEYGLLLEKAGRLKQAVSIYRQGLRRNPVHPGLHRRLTQSLEACEGKQSVERETRRFRKLAGEDSDYRRGVAALNSGDLDQAIERFRAALRDDPEAREVRRNLAVALFSKRDYTGAAAEYERLVAEEPSDSGWRLNLGAVLLEAGLLGEAVVELEESVRLNASSAQAHYRLGMAYRAQKQEERAMREFHQARRIDPQMQPPESP